MKLEHSIANKIPYLKSLTHCLNRSIERGYTENFRATERGLLSLDSSINYIPTDVEVVNFYRFEGVSDPADNSILYVIRAVDGAKGTLVDAYGPYSDPLVEKMIKQVESIHKNL